MIYLHKMLPLLASPLFLALMLLLWGAAAKRGGISLAGIGILIVCSLPLVSDKLVSHLEGDYILKSADTAKKADAIVVLSGMLRTIEGENGLAYEWTEAADRIFSGIDLVQEGKAPLLILTGGRLPWSVGKPEGEHLKEIAMRRGISGDMIRITEDVQNTEQEAKAVAVLLDKDMPKVLLVTSAFHMPRAQKVFEAAGIAVTPFPVDFLTGAKKITMIDFMPSAEAFKDTSLFVREVIGRLYYDWRY